MVDAARHPKVDVRTYTEVERVEGFVGNFQVQLREKSRYVIADRCNGCGLCFEVGCPAIFKSDRLDAKTGRAKAWIDPLLCTGCEICAQVCARKAILFREEMLKEGESA